MTFVDTLAFQLFSLAFVSGTLFYSGLVGYVTYLRYGPQRTFEHLRSQAVPLAGLGVVIATIGLWGEIAWPLPGSCNILFFRPLSASRGRPHRLRGLSRSPMEDPVHWPPRSHDRAAEHVLRCQRVQPRADQGTPGDVSPLCRDGGHGDLHLPGDVVDRQVHDHPAHFARVDTPAGRRPMPNPAP